MTNTTIHITAYGETVICTPKASYYENGRLAITLLYWDEDMQGWFPHAKVTVNMPDVHLNEGEVLVKDWAENEPIAAALLEAGWLLPTGREVSSGFVFPMVARPGGDLATYLETERP
jgi:hypothetical protein